MDITKNIIRCVLVESYAVENNLSCIIQAIFKGSCSSYQAESPMANYANEISSNVSITHLPHNQIFCFVAEAKNLTSTVMLIGSFSTSTGCNHMPALNSSYLAFFATEAIHQQTTAILSAIAVLIAVFTVVISVIVVYIILKRKQARKSTVVK